jgi:hypothetical protein
MASQGRVAPAARIQLDLEVASVVALLVRSAMTAPLVLRCWSAKPWQSLSGPCSEKALPPCRSAQSGGEVAIDVRLNREVGLDVESKHAATTFNASDRNQHASEALMPPRISSDGDSRAKPPQTALNSGAAPMPITD